MRGEIEMRRRPTGLGAVQTEIIEREKIKDALDRNTRAITDHLENMKPGKPSDEKRLAEIVKNRQYIWHRLQR